MATTEISREIISKRELEVVLGALEFLTGWSQSLIVVAWVFHGGRVGDVFYFAPFG